MKMNRLPPPKKQTQTNPISSKVKMNVISLAKKSGHTPTVNTLAEVIAKFATNRYYQKLIFPIPMSDVCNI